MPRTRLFSVTIKDCIVQTFRAGGKGGSNQNKRDTGVRIIHPESGAVGEARDSRSQLENKRAAFRRMSETPKFRIWLNKRVLDVPPDPSERVERSLDPANLLIEVRRNGQWERWPAA
jgi:hypothetical protein